MAMALFRWPPFLAVAGVVIALLAACAIQLRRDQDVAASSQASTTSEALDTPLTRCRTVVPEQVEAFEQCRRIWAENRRHFLRKDPSRAAAPDERAPDQKSEPQSPEGAR